MVMPMSAVDEVPIEKHSERTGPGAQGNGAFLNIWMMSPIGFLATALLLEKEERNNANSSACAGARALGRLMPPFLMASRNQPSVEAKTPPLPMLLLPVLPLPLPLLPVLPLPLMLIPVLPLPLLLLSVLPPPIQLSPQIMLPLLLLPVLLLHPLHCAGHPEWSSPNGAQNEGEFEPQYGFLAIH
jgi:hypothetical protein